MQDKVRFLGDNGEVVEGIVVAAQILDVIGAWNV